MSHVSGLAASIRNATESETFDLAGMGSAAIQKSTTDAFSEPLPLTEMIRITFITGAGKLGRQKYDDGAAKAITSTLRDLGFEEDRGASAVLECAGTFKMQHDTGKNLKTVVVFPKVAGGGEAGLNGMSLGGDDQGEPLIRENSPEQKLAYSSTSTFKRLIEGQCASWSQKKGCIAAMEGIKTLVQEVEAKLMSGTPLSPKEQDFYDAVSILSLNEKISFVRDLMHKQVDEGRINAGDRRVLLDQVGKKIEGIEKDLAAAEKDGRPQKALDNLKAAKAKAEERKQKLQKISPLPPYPLKNEAEIGKLRKELAPLIQIEEAGKGRLLSLKESQAVARKEEILQEITSLEDASIGWFESDADFDIRVEAARSCWAAKNKQTKKKTASAPAASASKWTTPAPRAKMATSKAKSSSKSSKPKGGNLFAAMMDDSDSD